jgi:hypothetical protein
MLAAANARTHVYTHTDVRTDLRGVSADAEVLLGDERVAVHHVQHLREHGAGQRPHLGGA